VKEPIDFMRLYKEKYGEFRVAICLNGTEGNMYWKHFIYPSEEFSEYFKYAHSMQPGHREIFQDELVIEGDLPKRQDNLKNSKWIEERLAGLNLTYKKYYSGSKSYHFHLFFPELLNYERKEIPQIKERILRYITQCSSASNSCKDCKMDTCKLRVQGIDLQLMKNHLIRLEYGIHNKTDRRKILIKERDFGVNLVPKFCIIKNKKLNNYYKEVGDFQPVYSKMPCISLLQTKEAFAKKVDARERILFVVVAQHKMNKVPQAKAIAAVLNWNEHALNNHFTESKVMSTIYSVYNSARVPGCTYIKSILRDLKMLEVCDGCKRGTAERVVQERGPVRKE